MTLKFKHRYEAAAFLGGFALMSLEIIASRIMAPIVGSSIYSWTAIIGIVLLGISLGNYYGGKKIDEIPKPEVIAGSLISSSIAISLIPILVSFADFFVVIGLPLLFSVSIIAIFLFLIPSFFLGTIFPSVVKLYISELEKAGEGSGLLSGLGALGSIIGTFLTGFFLIGFIGSSSSLYILSIILLIASLAFEMNIKRAALAMLIILILISSNLGRKSGNKNIIFETESDYYSIRVANAKYNGVSTKMLFLDLDSHSLEGNADKKTGIYQEISPVFSSLTNNIHDVLVIGGGSYQIPKDMVKLYDANVTVLEIDPAVTEVAKKFFGTHKYEMKTVNSDGRLFLRTNQQKFDIIFADAFSSFISMPWYMATKENFELSRNSLRNDGVYALNIISSREGKYDKLYKSILRTFAESFPNYSALYLGKNEEDIQNIIIIGKKSDKKINTEELEKTIQLLRSEDFGNMQISYSDKPEFDSKISILTDEFAPIEKITAPLVNSYINLYSRWARSILK